MDDLRIGRQQRRDLGAIFSGEELWKQLLVDRRRRIEIFHREAEVAPRILSPGIVLVDAGIYGNVLYLRQHVARGGDVIHGRERIDAEDIVARLLLEDARGAADVEEGEFLQFLGHGRDGEAAARGYVPDHHVDVIALHQVAVLGDDVRGRAGFIDEFRIDLGAAEPDLIVGRWRLSAVESLDQDLGPVAIGDAEGGGGGTAGEGYKADLDGRGRGLLSVRSAGRKEQREQQSGRATNPPAQRAMAHRDTS